MVSTINQNFISQFSDNLYHLVTKQEAKLHGLFSVEEAKGEKHFFDRLGSMTLPQIVGRLQPTVLDDASHSRRMATINRYGKSIAIDKLDQLKMLIDPTNDYAIEMASLHAQNFDTVLLEALLGTAASGADGSGSTAFDTSNQQIAHGSAGLTVAKFNQALRILQSNRVNIAREEIYLIANSRAIEDLLGENQFTSFDFQGVKALAGKDLPKFRGVNIVHSEDIPVHTAGSVYRAVLCTSRSLKVAMAKDFEVKMAERTDLDFATQVSSYMTFGAVRMDEARVVDILFQ